MPVIPVNSGLDTKRIIRRSGRLRRGEARGDSDLAKTIEN
jgi:hypothetical protein